MVTGLWGKKIGMTQFFSDDSVVPVTAIDVGRWFVLNMRIKDRDGYDAVQVGRLKNRYKDQTFVSDWLKKPNKFFNFIKEIPIAEPLGVAIGQQADFIKLLEKGNKVHISGNTIGRGFAGVVKRHNFAGSPGSHGHTMGDRPGSIGFMASCGKVTKGKKLPGHMGNVQRTMKNLEIIKVEEDSQVLFVKGSIPGKMGSLVFIRKI